MKMERYRLKPWRNKSSHLFWRSTSLKIEAAPYYKIFWHFQTIKYPKHERDLEFFELESAQKIESSPFPIAVMVEGVKPLFTQLKDFEFRG